MSTPINIYNWHKKIDNKSMKMTKKKKQVIEHAVTLFSEYGYNQIGVDRICEESNVSKMTVYKYFPTKELLFEAALMERNNNFIQALIGVTAQHADAIGRLKAIFNYYHDWFEQDDFVGCLFINSIALTANNENVLNIIKQNKRMIQQIIEGVLCFIVDSNKAPRIAEQIVKLLDGAIISAQLKYDENPAYSAWEAAVKILEAEKIEIDAFESSLNI